MTWMRASIFWK